MARTRAEGGSVLKITLLAALLSATAAAQMQLPPGTSAAVSQAQASPASSAQDQALQRVEESLADGKYQDALNLVLPLAVSAERNERVFYDLAFAHDALGQEKEAAAAYRSALERKPEDGTARVSLGLLLARGGDRAEAEKQLAQAVKTTALPPAVAGRALRALAQMHLESQPSQASEELIAALKLSGETTEDAALAAEIADAQHDAAAAEKAYAHAQAMEPAHPEVALGYARLLSREGKHAEAEAALDFARKAHPEDRQLLAEYASQELLLNRTERVLPLLLQLHDAHPDDSAIARLLGTAYIANGDAEKATPIYAALLKAAPDDPAAQVDWADCLIRQKRSAEAEPVLQRVVFKQGKTLGKDALANAAGMLAFAASSNHDPETVLTALALRDTLTSPSAAYTFLAASAHDTVHHTKQAAAQYRLFLQQSGGKFPDQEWQAHQRLQILDRTR